MHFFLMICFLCLSSCVEQSQKNQVKERNARKDGIHRLSHEHRYPQEPLRLAEPEIYPWEAGYIGNSLQ